MSSEADFQESRLDTLTEIFQAPSVLKPNQTAAEQLSQEFAGELDAESIEASLARASTVILDLPSDEVPSPDPVPATSPMPKYYVQGLVQGQQMCLITNLVGHESQLLLQPQGVWAIGRNREAAISLQDPMMSRRHAVIQYVQDEGFFLVDLNSMNGTFINGSKVQHRQALQDGDVVLMGNIAFTFFVSRKVRSLPAIHSEVLARLNAAEPRSLEFVDYLAFE
ncbi:MAG: FHA domain-containing protein [Scytolyngbya sp. HA4215-MV1]|jgi:hypothetical protein|nr:FHA domain-containing protein [Scytolyngbya sp. HA4215-MV1]